MSCKETAMIELEVKDITCSHCVATVTKAVEAAVPGARVRIDLPTRIVRVDGAPDAAAIETAIREAGYTPAPAKP
jgi:copper chaperone